MDTDQRALLVRYQEWLGTEAVDAGGVGPHEVDRLFDRHVLDSLAYLKGCPAEAATLLDVGGGVGLPSIPIAIVRPRLEVTIVDRSANRTRLARRALRILGLTNVDVVTADIDGISALFDAVTFRASLRIEAAARVTIERTEREGVGLFGVSRRQDTPTVPNAPAGVTFSLSSEGHGVLDSPFWLLKMQRT
ncbi:MAG: class I SAM-dependent methyltransferase [Actinomycetia bacterium]|nr:class I SAM-dependent methyltransferase [Actinomycetes bacterium]